MKINSRVIEVTLLILLLTAGVMWHHFRHEIPQSVTDRLRGKETVRSIQEKYSKSVFERMQEELHLAGFSTMPSQIAILAFKEEEILELYGIRNDRTILIKRYPFTSFSGTLGPKLKEGDFQIPEGIYTIEYLNPNSRFHLSAKISYPNKFDRKQADKDSRSNLGGDIMIHGSNVTIGCIPIGDTGIEELFILLSKVQFTQTPIIISPRDFRTNVEYPLVRNCDWTEELYDSLSAVLQNYPQGESFSLINSLSG